MLLPRSLRYLTHSRSSLLPMAIHQPKPINPEDLHQATKELDAINAQMKLVDQRKLAVATPLGRHRRGSWGREQCSCRESTTQTTTKQPSGNARTSRVATATARAKASRAADPRWCSHAPVRQATASPAATPILGASGIRAFFRVRDPASPIHVPHHGTPPHEARRCPLDTPTVHHVGSLPDDATTTHDHPGALQHCPGLVRTILWQKLMSMLAQRAQKVLDDQEAQAQAEDLDLYDPNHGFKCQKWDNKEGAMKMIPGKDPLPAKRIVEIAKELSVLSTQPQLLNRFHATRQLQEHLAPGSGLERRSHGPVLGAPPVALPQLSSADVGMHASAGSPTTLSAGPATAVPPQFPEHPAPETAAGLLAYYRS